PGMPPTAVRAQRAFWAWACLGLAGSLLVALAGPRVAGEPVRWWFQGGGGVAVLYAGILALLIAWVALGRRALTVRQLWMVAAIWTGPMFLAAPLFSQDVYSYLAQGTLVHLGLDPYTQTPAVLAQHGQAHVLSAVSPFWRHTTAPYGPLFLWIVSWFTGTSLVVGVLLVRTLELIGFALLAAFVPRLARNLGADPGRATWLVLLSPLVLFELVAAAHNDLLMIGLLVAGVSLAVERRVLPAVALCALAATIKLPAAAAIPFILVAAGDRRTVITGVLVAVGVVVAVGIVSGLGFSWISTSVFSTPGKVRLAITPATALGWTVAQIVPVGARALESALGVVAFCAAVMFGLVLLWRTTRGNMVRYLGFALIAVAVCGPAAWPWYLTWGLVLLAACPGVQWSLALVLVALITPLMVKADGVLAFPLHTSPAFVALYVAAGAVALRRRPSVASSRLRPIAES
ncbi:MAG: polyprenol phosphomannose-dependent alpha 1,6 mannosyltransferase MptB, partial [Solirubrobacterales bacterium]|nr:polyprenol phosphomannose-dependent alpha 1,6 mannosyltransferase MptB [Solirubrobacterales bacterium]